MNISNIALGAIALSILAGCASSQGVSVNNVSIQPATHPLNEIRSIAIEARDELRLLSKAVEANRAPSLTPEQHAQRHFQATYVPAGFEKMASFSYTGSASKAAKALAQIADYSFAVRGEPLPNEPWVAIKTADAPLNEALKELGVQTGSSATVEVHEATRQIFFVYKR